MREWNIININQEQILLSINDSRTNLQHQNSISDPGPTYQTMVLMDKHLDEFCISIQMSARKLGFDLPSMKNQKGL